MKQITIGLFIALILVPSVSFAQVPMTDVQKQQLIATLLAQVKVLQLKLAQLQAQPRVSAQVTRDAKAAELKAKKNARIAEEEVKWRAEEQKEKDDRLAQVSKEIVYLETFVNNGYFACIGKVEYAMGRYSVVPRGVNYVSVNGKSFQDPSGADRGVGAEQCAAENLRYLASLKVEKMELSQ